MFSFLTYVKLTNLFIFSGGSYGKESACNAGDLGLIPGSGRSLEKGMATHSSILAWRIPWTEEPGGLQCIGSQTGGHNWVANHYAPLWGPEQWCLGFPGISLFTPLFNYNRILSVHLSILRNGISLVCLFCFLFYLTNHGADSIHNLGFAFLT